MTQSPLFFQNGDFWIVDVTNPLNETVRRQVVRLEYFDWNWDETSDETDSAFDMYYTGSDCYQSFTKQMVRDNNYYISMRKAVTATEIKNVDFPVKFIKKVDLDA